MKTFQNTIIFFKLSNEYFLGCFISKPYKGFESKGLSKNLSFDLMRAFAVSGSCRYLCLFNCRQTVLHLHGFNHTDLLTLCDLDVKTHTKTDGQVNGQGNRIIQK